MVIHRCEHCTYQTTCKRDLVNHQNKKYKCYEAPWKCAKCSRPFHEKTKFYAHQKKCTGPIKTAEEVFNERVQEYEERIAELTKPADVIKTIEPVGFGKLADCIESQVYFGLPGSLLIPEIELSIEDIVIKFGSTKDPGSRMPKHNKDFGGFTLLDSIVSDNPVDIEDKIREWLKINNRLIRGKTENKNTTDTELFVVKSQSDYETIVKIANVFAEEQKKKIHERASYEMDLERQRLEHEKESVLMQREIMRLRVGGDAAKLI